MKSSPQSLALAALLLAVAGSGSAETGWAPGTCGSVALAAGRAATERQIREALPDSSLWVPHPFAVEPAAVVENVLVRHRLAYSDLDEKALPGGERRLFALEREKGLRVETVQVADWTPKRCDRSERRDFTWLVRFFDRRSGTEVTRILARESGHIAQVIHADTSFSLPPLPPLSKPKVFSAWLSKADSSSVQYVTTWGPEPCDPLIPCVAWRVGSGFAIAKGNQLFTVDEQSERLSFSADLGQDDAWEIAARVKLNGKRLISLGGDDFAAASVVEPIHRRAP